MDRIKIVVINEQQYKELTAVTWHFQHKKLDIEHCLLGINSEIGELESAIKKQIGYGKELDLVNIKEELGDLLFYIFRLSDFSGKVLSVNLAKEWASLDFNENLTTMDIIQICNDIRSFAFISCQADIQSLVPHDLQRTLGYVCILIKHFKFEDIFDIMTTNIRKLAVRFPDKFDSHLVSERDLKKERDILNADNSK